jgi:hypothetical protein
MYFHVFSFPAFFVIEKNIASLDHWHVNPLLTFAECFCPPYCWSKKEDATAQSVKQQLVHVDQFDPLQQVHSCPQRGSLLLPV